MADFRDEASSIASQACAIVGADARKAFLERQCGENSELLAQVLASLNRLEETRLGVRTDVAPETTLAYDTAVEFEEVGSTVGPYKLRHRLGEGGFGTVYMAEQEKPVRRQVAFKMIKLGMDTKQVIGRFEAERQALALMDHPNIAKVFDAGATPSGRPFFVMELVKGQPITQFCDKARLGVRDRLGLFVTVCNAVHHAHERGIIHRDIKPSNVLVSIHDEAPCPKVIDFGIAKATQQRLTELSVVTAFNQMVGTPLYMSPEQAQIGGPEVDARCDIYSLGALLYELLTGSTPITDDAFGQTDFGEISRLIREQEPPRPSRRISALGERRQTIAEARGLKPSSLNSLLRGELDWIVMKCLEKDRRQRYSSARELAADVKRYLANEPVLAQPPSILYRVRKTLGRHRDRIVAAGLVVGALVVCVAVSLVFFSLATERAGDVRRVADSKLLADLGYKRRELLKIEPALRRQAMDDWIAKAEELIRRRSDYQSAVEGLRAEHAGEPGDPGQSPANSNMAGAIVPWRFVDRGVQKQHDLYQQLLAEIDAFTSSHGPLREVKLWAQRMPTPAESSRRWTDALVAIETRYAGLRLEPLPGLLPLGPDKQSGLWEFADLSTGLAPVPNGGNASLDELTGVILVLVPGGEFMMGSPSDEPGRREHEQQHRVVLDPFLISKYEVTQPQWDSVMGSNASPHQGFDLPVQNVSWEDCQSFCRKTGCSLPTEAQWEYACRAGSTSAYCRTEPLTDLGWVQANANNRPHPVGGKLPNAFGLFDLHGNMQEWCQDVYSVDYYSRPQAAGPNPVNEAAAADASVKRVLRGGLYEGGAAYARCANRYMEKPGQPYKGFGLRPARTVQRTAESSKQEQRRD